MTETDRAAMARVERALMAARVRENMIASRVILGILCLLAVAPVTFYVLLDLTLGLRSGIFGTLLIDTTLPMSVILGACLVAAGVLGVGGLVLILFCVRLGARWWPVFWWTIGSYAGILALTTLLVALT